MIDLAQVPPEQRERVGAICELLKRPDPPELNHRGHQVTVDGRASRFQEYLDQPNAYAHIRRNERSPIVAELKRVTRRKAW